MLKSSECDGTPAGYSIWATRTGWGRKGGQAKRMTLVKKRKAANDDGSYDFMKTQSQANGKGPDIVKGGLGMRDKITKQAYTKAACFA